MCLQATARRGLMELYILEERQRDQLLNYSTDFYEIVRDVGGRLENRLCKLSAQSSEYWLRNRPLQNNGLMNSCRHHWSWTDGVMMIDQGI